MKKIDRVMARFRIAMLKKFHEKEDEGYTGWDKQMNWKDIVNGIFKHALKEGFTTDDLIDIALYCLFLWNLETEE